MRGDGERKIREKRMRRGHGLSGIRDCFLGGDCERTQLAASKLVEGFVGVMIGCCGPCWLTDLGWPALTILVFKADGYDL